MSKALGTRLSDLLSMPVSGITEGTGRAGETPETVEQWFREGVRLLKEEDYLMAAIKMGAVMLVQPDNIKAMNNLAVAFYSLGRIDEALNVLDEALALDPDNSTALRNRKKIMDEMEE